MKNSKKIMAATLLIASGYAGLASAHALSGAVGIATSGVARADVYAVTCSNDGSGAPAKLAAHVKNLAPVKPPKVGIQLVKGTKSTIFSIDPVDGDAAFSPFVTLVGGAGVYTMIVQKLTSTAIGIQTYVAEFHCQTAGGVHTGTTWRLVSNG